MKANSLRIHNIHDAPISKDGKYVLYWMIAARRVQFNFALERAAGWARELGKPLVILEALRVDYPWASDRLHQFVIEGMADTAQQLKKYKVLYYPYIEPEPNSGRGLLKTLAADAALVVSDAYPAFFLRRMISATAPKLGVRFEAVDSNGLLPMAAGDREFSTAYSFRRFLHKNLPSHLDDLPLEDPLLEDLPLPAPLDESALSSWPKAPLGEGDFDLNALPIDHNVGPTALRGGASAARAALGRFLDSKLGAYNEARNRPDEDGASGLSPYLHFGHLSSHQIFLELMTSLRWTPEDLSPRADGRRSGWWGVSETAEAFLDQFITWRELGFNLCFHRSDHDQYSALPEWAKLTLGEHAGDPREYEYSLEEFQNSATHDPLWNAAQRQLVSEGRIHNYLRMLWGKKILEWSIHPQQALEIMFELNNRFALDGRDPNSSSGILWTLGRFDRAWGPERPIFGKIRYMSSANTARKFSVKSYLSAYGPSQGASS